jgi:hypothetical protein
VRRWLRFATARGLETVDSRVFDAQTRFFVGFDWVRFARPTANSTFERARRHEPLGSFRIFAMRLNVTEHH